MSTLNEMGFDPKEVQKRSEAARKMLNAAAARKAKKMSKIAVHEDFSPLGDVITLVASQQPAEASSILNDLLSARVTDALQSHKQEIAQSLFAPGTAPLAEDSSAEAANEATDLTAYLKKGGKITQARPHKAHGAPGPQKIKVPYRMGEESRSVMSELKEFSAFREELSEHVNVPSHSMPPNILILRRKTVRQFPDGVMVALYQNDKLDLHFSIPYGGVVDSVVTPVALKEDMLNEISIKTAAQAYDARMQRSDKALGVATTTKSRVISKSYGIDAVSHFAKAQATKRHLDKKLDRSTAGETVKEETLNEDAISHLRKVKEFHTGSALRHKDGTQTKVDPTTAHALLTVHGALHPDNQKKMADAMEHSKAKFHRIVDFAWKQVK